MNATQQQKACRRKIIKVDPNQKKLSFSPSNFEDVDKNNNALVDNKNNTSTVT
jgi:hypothetical protein